MNQQTATTLSVEPHETWICQITGWQQNNSVPPTGLLPVQSASGDHPFTRQAGGRGTQTERQRMLTHSRPSGLMGKKNSRHRSLQNASSCFWPDPGMEIAALYKAELIWGQLEPMRKHGISYGLCCSLSTSEGRIVWVRVWCVHEFRTEWIFYTRKDGQNNRNIL